MEQATKNDRKMDPLGQLKENGADRLTEGELRKAYGGGRATRHDLRGLVKTLWAIGEKAEGLTAAVDRLSAMLYTASIGGNEKLIGAIDRLCERIDELINLR